MKGDLGEIATNIKRCRRVEGKIFSVVLQVLERFFRAAYEKDRYFQRRITLIPCEHTRLWRVTLEYRHPSANIEQQAERPVENAATLGDLKNRHGLQTALGFQHEATGLEIVANHEVSLGPPDAGILRAATRSRGLRRERCHAGEECQRAETAAKSDLRERCHRTGTGTGSNSGNLTLIQVIRKTP